MVKGNIFLVEGEICSQFCKASVSSGELQLVVNLVSHGGSTESINIYLQKRQTLKSHKIHVFFIFYIYLFMDLHIYLYLFIHCFMMSFVSYLLYYDG